jgi:AcrR family transcriptional regulator
MTDARRDALLEQIVDYVLAHGVTGLTLRSLATAVGSNNRMLLYYFGSREQLVLAALDGAEQRFTGMPQIVAALDDDGMPVADRLRRAWETIADPDNLPFHRLFFEIFGVAGFEPERYTRFLGTVGTEWVAHVAGALHRSGVPSASAETLAHETVALWRGLQATLLGGGDLASVDAAAHNAMAAMIERAEAAKATATLRNRPSG